MTEPTSRTKAKRSGHLMDLGGLTPLVEQSDAALVEGVDP